MTVIIGGHRGSGCTDSPHAQNIGQVKPPENTLESIELAIKNGAKLIEVDAVQTADNHLVVIHSNALSNHVFGHQSSESDIGFVADHTLEDLQQFKVGPHGTHTIPTLREVLDLCKDVALNIEIKDVKGTDTAKFTAGKPTLVDLLADEIAEHPGSIIVSSFSIWDLVAMKERLPDVPRAQLFETIKKDERPIYGDDCPDDSWYRMFNVANVLEAIRRADVQYVHPCIDSMHEEVVALCEQYNLSINTWALHENLPAQMHAQIATAVNLCKEHGVQLGIITDFVPEMLELIPQISLDIEGVSRLMGLDEGPSL